MRDDEKKKVSSYEIFNLIHWLNMSDPDCDFVKKELEEIKKRNPGFEPSDFPDFLFHLSAEFVEVQSPISSKDLLEKDPSELIDLILGYIEDKKPGSYRYEILKEVEGAVSKSFEWSIKLAESLKESEELNSELLGTIFIGWKYRNLNHSEWNSVLHFINETPELFKINSEYEIYHHANGIASLLRSGVEKKLDGAIPSKLLDIAEGIASKLWNSIDVINKEEFKEEKLTMTRAINHPGGSLTEFWIHTISRKQIESGEDWEEIPVKYKEQLNYIVKGHSYKSYSGIMTITKQIIFLFSIDKKWVLEKIVPLFNWEFDKNIAKSAWIGYLWQARWNEGILSKLLTYYKQSIEKLNFELSEVKDQFIKQIASIFLNSRRDLLHDGILQIFFKNASDNEKVLFAQYVRFHLQDFSEKRSSAKLIWERKIKKYWEDRINGIPQPLNNDEKVVMLDLIFELDKIFPKVAEMIIKSPPPEISAGFFFYQFNDGNFVDEYPEKTAELLNHLLSGPIPKTYRCEDFEGIVEKLVKNGVSTGIISGLCEKLLEIGCIDEVKRLRQLLEE